MKKENHRPQKEPERSLTLRLVVLAAMLVALFALGRVHAGLWPFIVIAANGIGLGHWYSYRHLDRSTTVVRAIMFMLVHLALCWLIMGLAIGATVPQAQFAIYAQAITSFDLRYRRSLFTTLFISLAILYVAASLSRTYELFIYLLAFAVLVLAAFYIAAREDGLKTAKAQPSTRPGSSTTSGQRSMTLFGISFGATAVLALFVVFMVVPRFANNPIVPPFTINIPLEGGVKSEIINPGVPLVQVNGWSNDTGDYFYGFDTNLDLRYRGGLSDAIVMYVRSPSRSYWRSHSYDEYSGVSWSQSDKSLLEMEPEVGVYYKLDKPLGSPLYAQPAGEGQRIVQSFTIVRQQPNLVFAAYRPSEIYITASQLSLDSGDGIRLPEALKPGFTYSVASLRPNFDPELLRQASTEYPAYITHRYLQLPNNISQRTKNLAGRLTADHTNPYDKVTALADYLRTEYPYNNFPPPHPPGAEVVDTFLFEDQQGICEQYVTALVVMARSLGIPARLTTGYGAGTHNPITNYYEVRLNDAHSWAEVYFPGYGWVPFDPTPGWTPQPYPTPVQNWLFANQGGLWGLEIPAAPFEQLAASGLLSLNVIVPLLVGSVFVVALVWGLIYVFKNWRRAGPPQRDYSSLPPDPRRTRILQLYKQGTTLVEESACRPRHRWEALTEYARQVRQLPALIQLTQAAEIAAYRTAAPDKETVTQAETALTILQENLSRND